MSEIFSRGISPFRRRNTVPHVLMPDVRHGSSEQGMATGTGSFAPDLQAGATFEMYQTSENNPLLNRDPAPTPPIPGSPRASTAPAPASRATLALPDGPVGERQDNMPQGWGPRVVTLTNTVNELRTQVDNSYNELRAKHASHDKKLDDHVKFMESLNNGLLNRIDTMEKAMMDLQMGMLALQHNPFSGQSTSQRAQPPFPQRQMPTGAQTPIQESRPQRFNIADNN